MGFFVPQETKSVEISSPDGDTATVEIRPLNAGDVAYIQDQIRMQAGDNSPEVKLGQFRFAMVERALVTWSLPEDLTPNTIRKLEPAVFDQIFEAVNAAPLEQNEEKS